MSILLCVSIAWAISGLLFVGLCLVLLLIIEHASNSSQPIAVDEPVQKVRAQLEEIVTLAPRDAIPTAHRAMPDQTQHTGAVIIRDPRLTRARTLSDQKGVGLDATFVFPAACSDRDTAA